MPADHVIASLCQTLLHELTIQRTATDRLTRSSRRSATRANGHRADGNVFQVMRMCA